MGADRTERLFFLDPETGERMGYAELFALIREGRMWHRPWCRPRSVGAAFMALTTALVADRELTLVDPDFGLEELGRLGVDPGCLEAVEPVAPVHGGADLGEVLARVRAVGRSRLTLYTSGSTGLPRAVTHGLPGLCRGVRVGDRHREDVWGFAYNPTHVAGVQVFLQALFNQNPLINLFRLGPARIQALLREHGISHLSATPTFHRLLWSPEAAFPEVRAVTLGGEPADRGLLERLRSMFPRARFRNVYASTEAGTLLSSESDCFAIPADLADRVVVRDGRLQVHRSLVGAFAGDGPVSGDWYDTGDVVEAVAGQPGRFRIVSRDRDWVNVGGEKVNPAAVEQELAAHPQVREARVYGRPNAVLGHLLCADVVPMEAAPAEAELRAYLASRLAPAQVPRLIRMVRTIDRTRTGKVRRDG